MHRGSHMQGVIEDSNCENPGSNVAMRKITHFFGEFKNIHFIKKCKQLIATHIVSCISDFVSGNLRSIDFACFPTVPEIVSQAHSVRCALIQERAENRSVKIDALSHIRVPVTPPPERGLPYSR